MVNDWLLMHFSFKNKMEQLKIDLRILLLEKITRPLCVSIF